MYHPCASSVHRHREHGKTEWKEEEEEGLWPSEFEQKKEKAVELVASFIWKTKKVMNEFAKKK